MKSEHRHELKSNELADWLSNLPQWAKDNLGSVIIVAAAIAVFAGYFGWKSISTKARSGEHEEFTAMVDSVLGLKAEVVYQQMSNQGSDMSYLLLNKANDLEMFSGKTGNENIAALALVKAADSIRTELQYRADTVSQKDLVDKINQAKQDYTKAFAKNPSDKTIKGLAEFGLGLCAEDLGNFDEARGIYKKIAENKDYEGTIVLTKANMRLKIMDDYTKDIEFKPAPPKPVYDANSVLNPLTELVRNTPSSVDISDTNYSGISIDSVMPVETNLPAEVIDIPVEANSLEQ